MVHRHRPTPFVLFRPFVAVLVAVVLAVMPLVAAAQEATPAGGGDAWYGQEPDLAAMSLTPADLEAMGLSGYGKFSNGFFNSVDNFIEGQAMFYGRTVEETRAVLEGLGLSRMYGSARGLPSVPGEDSPPERWTYGNIFEVQNESDAFLDFIIESGTAADAKLTAMEAPFDLGGRAVIYIYSDVNPENGDRYFEYSTIFRVEGIYVDTGFSKVIPAGDLATPEATPVSMDPTTATPAGTIAELEALGRRQKERVEGVLANGSPNLPGLLLRLGETPVVESASYSEGYRLLDGELFPYYAGFEDDILADPNATTGAEAVYELEERFQRGEEEVPSDPYFLTRLYQFPDEAAAIAFMASRPEVLATGGFHLATGATDDARYDVLPGEAGDLGDESMAFDFVRAFDDGAQFDGYEVYVRVGVVVTAVSVEGPPDMPLEQVTELAAAQAGCLEAGECPNAYPIPEYFTTPLEATPEATPAA